MPHLLILNPQAGPKTAVGDELRDAARRLRAEVYVPEGKADLDHRVEQFAKRDGTRVIAAGGDGTVNHVLNAVMAGARNLELGIVPVGTANDLARCLDLNRDDHLAALEFALAAEAIPIDVVHIEGAGGFYFSNVGWGGFGMEEGETAELESKEKWGPFAYWMRAAASISDAATMDLSLTLDGVGVELCGHGLAIGNGRYLGGFPIVPEALLDDGLVEVAAVRAQGSLEMLGAAVNTLLGRQERDEKIFHARAQSIRIESSRPLRLKFDGEPLEGDHFELKVLPRSLRVVANGRGTCVQGNGQSA